MQVSGHITMGYLKAYEAVERGVSVAITLHGVDGLVITCHPPIDYLVPTLDRDYGMWPENDGVHHSITVPVGTVLDEDGNGADEIVARVKVHDPETAVQSPDPASLGCVESTAGKYTNEVNGEFSGQPGGGEHEPPPQGPLPPPPPVVVPDLIGDTVPVASQELQAAGLALGKPTDVVNCDSIARITSSNPPAGALTKPGTAVTVSVGAKPKPSKVCQ